MKITFIITACLAYNIVATPAAVYFEVMLPDSSKAWQNNASSLHQPAVCTANDREVELTGEMYFEVASMAGSERWIALNDVDAGAAWKNGLFYFEHADINTVMRLIARWYDMDVEYGEGALS